MKRARAAAACRLFDRGTIRPLGEHLQNVADAEVVILAQQLAFGVRVMAEVPREGERLDAFLARLLDEETP
jgi:hypothetical protein